MMSDLAEFSGFYSLVYYWFFWQDSCGNSETVTILFIRQISILPLQPVFSGNPDFHQIVAQIAGIISAKDNVTLYVGKKGC